MHDLDAVTVEIQNRRVVVGALGVADGGLAVDLAAGFEGGGEEGVDG